MLTVERCSAAILITTSDFSSGAIKAAEDEPRVRLVNGVQLVELLVEHHVGLARGEYGEIVVAAD